jgi:hypothetical protein
MTMTHDGGLPWCVTEWRMMKAPAACTLSQLSGTGLIRLAMDPAGGRMVSKSHILIWSGLCKHSGRSSMWGVRR